MNGSLLTRWWMMALLTISAAVAGAQAQGVPVQAPSTVNSQTPGQEHPLWPGQTPFAQGTAPEDIPTLTTYLPATNPTRTAVIVAPGGGYAHLSMTKEGSDIALWLNRHGVAAFVLKYRLGPKYRHPVELGDAQRAIRTVRAQAAQYGIAADHIGMWGFSAGGHLTATAGTLYDQGPPASADAIDRESAKPDFMVLAYPVITFSGPYAHTGSREYLLAPEQRTPELKALLSPELHVTAQTPPAFLFATTDDGTVPVMNSVAMYSALVAAKVPAEMHLYQHGPHGVGLAPGFPDLKDWPGLLATWMRSHGYMAPALAGSAALLKPVTDEALCRAPLCILN